MTVRLMAPFSMKCTSCGEYIYKGRKFNARKETTEEKYLTISIFRFYIRCTRCSSEITFKTDPKNMDYTCERGAKRNFEPWRNADGVVENETDEERLDRLEREEAEELENAERNAMEELEQKMMDSKREMQIADALDEIRTRNARIERGEKGVKEDEALDKVRYSLEEQKARQEQEDEEAAKKAFEERNVWEARRAEQEAEANSTIIKDGPIDEEREAMPPPPPSFERLKKAKKPSIPGLVKKVEVAKPMPTPAASSGLGLDDYNSDSD